MPILRWSSVVLGALLFLSQSSLAMSECYFPDGTVAKSDAQCDNTKSESHCCSTDGEACLSGNLCWVAADASTNTGTCTDSTWGSTSSGFTECELDSSGVVLSDPELSKCRTAAINTLYRCTNDGGSDTQWCCSGGINNTACCDDGDVHLFSIDHQTIINGTVWGNGYTLVPSDRVMSTTTSTGTLASTSTSAAAGSASTSACSNKGNEKPVGLGVGLGMGVPLLAALGTALFFLARERRARKKLTRTLNSGFETPVKDDEIPRGGYTMVDRHSELPTAEESNVMQEMSGTGENKK